VNKLFLVKTAFFGRIVNISALGLDMYYHITEHLRPGKGYLRSSDPLSKAARERMENPESNTYIVPRYLGTYLVSALLR